MSTKIVVSEKDTLFRDGLCSLINSQPGIKVVGEASDGKTALELVRQLLPDILIIYIDMFDQNGIDLIQQITSELPHTKVIALTADPEAQFIIEVFRAGASAYLLKSCSHEEVKRSIGDVVKNRTYLSPKAAKLIINNFAIKSITSDIPAFSLLTEREHELFQLISEGKSINQIASHLNRSRKTVELYRRKLLKKLNIPNTIAITNYAIREGLVSV